MFKIIETIEKGSKQLTIVPSEWETNGQLAWPKFKTDKLIKIADSTPEDSWVRMKCKLKRNHLLNYDVAEEELERMLDYDEMEQEDHIVKAADMKKRPRVILPRRNLQYTNDDFNSCAETCLERNKTVLETPSTSTNGVNFISHRLIGTQDSLQFETSQGGLPDPYNPSTQSENSFVLLRDITSTFSNQPVGENVLPDFQTNDMVTEKVDLILANQATIIENQNSIIEKLQNMSSAENQMLIIRQLAKFETMIDALGSNLHNARNRILDVEEKTKEDADVMEPIETSDSLEDFEKKLSDKKVMEEFIRKLSYICGKKGNGCGINNCYLLVDRFFSRKFMTLCSWAGGARDKKEKIAFKVYKNVITLFFKVVNLSDENFTLKDCEEFFKSVLRNSTRRNDSSMVRTSTVKRRPKNLSYKVKENSMVEAGETTTNENNVNANAIEIICEEKERSENKNLFADEGFQADDEDDATSNI